MDLKPPKLAAGERETLLALWQYHRDSVVRKVSGLDDEAARRELVGSGTTLLWLVQHLAHAETLWIVERFAGEAAAAPEPADTLEGAVAEYQAAWARVDAIVAATPTLEEPCRNLGEDVAVNLRWVLMHLLEETARHAGHADVLRELIDGQIGR